MLLGSTMIEPTIEILKSECTLCDHKLDHYALMVCSHPTLPVPLCLLCLEDVTGKLQDNEDESTTGEQCSWCGMCEQGDLFICGDGTTCKHLFCSDCLERNLGSSFVSSLNDSDEDWKCLVCDSNQVSDLTDALKACVTNSIYTADAFLRAPHPVNAFENKDVGDGSTGTRKKESNGSNEKLSEAEDEIENDMNRLRIILRQIELANKSLEDDTVSLRETDIRTEIIGSGSTDAKYVYLISNCFFRTCCLPS